jgi:RNA polymerase sigma-70 factor, ECF subfamily
MKTNAGKKPDTEYVWNNFCCSIKAFIIKRVSDKELADDIFQDVFIKIHSKIDTLKDHSKINSWIFSIAANTINDHFRKTKKNGKIENDDFLSENEDSIGENLHSEVASDLKKIVNSLPEKYGEAILLVEFNGMSQTDMAKKLGISVSGAKSRVQRGRQMLRDILMNCCHFEFDRYGTVIDSHPVSCCCCRRE